MADTTIDNLNSISVNRSSPALSLSGFESIYVAPGGQVVNLFQFANGTRADALRFDIGGTLFEPDQFAQIAGLVIGNIRMNHFPVLVIDAGGLVIGDIFLVSPTQFSNSGTITGSVTSDAGRLYNFGHITGNVTVTAVWQPLTTEFTNSGTIDGLVTLRSNPLSTDFLLFDGSSGTAVKLLLIGDNIGATGSMSGDQIFCDAGNQSVAGRGGNDIFYSAGLIAFGTTDGDDTLHGGAGFDSFSAVGLLDDILGNLTTGQLSSGELGNDTLISIEHLSGGDGDDDLTGNAAGNRLDGGFGLDTLKGLNGNDNLNGGADADRVEGGAGRDFLEGGNGVDVLIGGAGNDTLHGGDDVAGDRMSGGTGADTFIYYSSAESLDFAGLIDTIAGFQHGVDIIDLSILDAQPFDPAINEAFVFVGSGPLTQGGQLRVNHRADGNTYVEMSSLFGPEAFTVIRLAGNIVLDAGDFFL